MIALLKKESMITIWKSRTLVHVGYSGQRNKSFTKNVCTPREENEYSCYISPWIKLEAEYCISSLCVCMLNH
jgi:hypothetical protein